MTTRAAPMTADELRRMAEVPGRRHALVDGELIEMTPAGHDHGRIANRIAARLTEAADRERLGAVYAAETGFVIGRAPDTVLAPDAAFVRSERVPDEGAGFFEGAPDLAVELAMPSERIEDVEAKAQRWLGAGARLVWVVWPQTRSVVVHRPSGARAIRHEGDELDGEDVIPGFACPVEQIFA